MSTAEQASVAPSGRVIRAKVRPPPTDEWVKRPRPEALLAEALESRRVVVVSATAGAGKTTLVAAVAARSDRPVAWLTLDWTDRAPGRLVTYLEAALAEVVPRTEGVAREALAARVPHQEAVGLLVEAVAGERVVLVIDELERLGEEPESQAVIEALLRYAPSDMRVVLCSRRPVPASILPRRPGEVIHLGDEALALTVTEAAAILDELGRPAVDPAAAVKATGGWITGVLFEAWRLDDHAGDGHDDPLHGYLSAHILGQLGPEDREFLIVTSVLTVITAARAAALGVRDPRARLVSLRHAHIPGSWSDGGHELRCHPRFREYLQSELVSWPTERLHDLSVAHGVLLASEDHFEEATEVLLRAGAKAEALKPAATAIGDVINRLDFAQAQRWLDALSDVEPDGLSPFAIARLTLAWASEYHRPGVELADRLAARGQLGELASSSSLAAMMVGQCYVMAGRYDDMMAICAQAPHDADYENLSAFVGVYATEPPPSLAELIHDPPDSLVIPIIWCYGRLGRVLTATGIGGWRQAFSQPWRVAALADVGRVQEAVDLLEDVRHRGAPNAVVEGIVAAHVLTDAGRRAEAKEASARGRRLAREASSLIWELLAEIELGRLFLRLDRDPVGALAALDPVDRHPITRRTGFLGPWVDCWYGFALLLQDRDDEALERLRRSVALFRRTGQMLNMPAAAVYLAEAEWRMGNEEPADEAADLALEAARVQGSNHMLLLALRDFPAVLSRRVDAEAAADSPWHELVHGLRAQGLEVEGPVHPVARLAEFGRVELFVEGEEVPLRLAKALELLAYLLSRPQHRADRDQLLDALFDSRADDSTKSYLRQAIRRLRDALPPGGMISDRETVALSDRLAIVSDSHELQRALATAAGLRGADRLAATLAALEIVDQGPYLAGSDSQWIEERRQWLRELTTDARCEAAELAFAEGQLRDAERLSDAVLNEEPFHEAAWRLKMRLADATGDERGMLTAYEHCARVLAEVGAEPSTTTRNLVDQLRH